MPALRTIQPASANETAAVRFARDAAFTRVTRESYRVLVQHRSRIIAEVMRREVAGEAMSQAPTVAAAVSTNTAQSVTDENVAGTSVAVPSTSTQEKMTEALAIISHVDNFATMDHTTFRQAVVDIGVQLGANEYDIRAEERESQTHIKTADQRGKGNFYYQLTVRPVWLKWENVRVDLSMLAQLLLFVSKDAAWNHRVVGAKGEPFAQYISKCIVSRQQPLQDAEAEQLARAFYDELMRKISLVSAAVGVEAPTNVADQAVNSGLTFVGANPETVIAQPPAPPSSKPE